jgi:multidrug efflux pump subunit AcrA (membrane-fusion protein)
MTIRISWHILGLTLLFAAAVVAAVLELGPPASSARTSRELVTAANGIVQSTVTGTGNVEPATEVEANFQTSGTLKSVYVSAGDHVVKGQLLATLDPTAAQLSLDQAQENLTAAEDDLTNAEDQKPTTTTTTTTTATTPTATTAAATPARTTPARTSTGTGSTSSGSTGSGSTSSGATGTGSTGSGSTGESAQTIAANIATAQGQVDSAEASVKNAETAVDETHLYAPASGTVVSVEDISPGGAVSAGSSTGSSASSASTGSSSSSGLGSSTAGSLGGSSSSSSSSGFVEIINTSRLTMTVAFSESDISSVRVGEPADVTLDALTGVELAGHVSAVSPLGTTSSSVVSYDATITIDQHDAKVKPGMSASASVITGQASGVNLPSSAVSGTTGTVARVEVMKSGKEVSTPVIVGVVGDTRTQIVSGLKAGQQVVVTETLPSLSTTSSSSGSSSSGTLGGTSRFGGGGGGFAARLLGGGGGFGGG